MLAELVGVVAVETNVFEISRVQCDALIVYVPWCEFDFVVHNITRFHDAASEATLAQSADAGDVLLAAFLPRCRGVKRF